MSTTGFTFANPTYTADNFYQYSAGDLQGDSGNMEDSRGRSRLSRRRA